MFGKILLVILGIATCSFAASWPLMAVPGLALICYGLFKEDPKAKKKKTDQKTTSGGGSNEPYTGRFQGDDTIASFDRDGNRTPVTEMHSDIDGHLHTPSGSDVEERDGHYYQ